MSYVGPDVVIPTHYPIGSTAPQEFLKHLDTLDTHVLVKADIEKTFTYTPFRVE